MHASRQFNILIGNNWFNAVSCSMGVTFTILEASPSVIPEKKLSCDFKIDQQSGTIACFENPHQLLTFMKDPQHFTLDCFRKQITLHWNLVAKSYQKPINYTLKLDEIPLDKIDKLRFQNFFLKKQLDLCYKRADQNLYRGSNFDQKVVYNYYNNSNLMNGSLKIEEDMSFMNQVENLGLDQEVMNIINHQMKNNNGTKKKKSRAHGHRNRQIKKTKQIFKEERESEKKRKLNANTQFKNINQFQSGNYSSVNIQKQKQKSYNGSPTLQVNQIGNELEEEGYKMDEQEIKLDFSVKEEKQPVSIMVQKPHIKYRRTIVPSPYQKLQHPQHSEKPRKKARKVRLEFQNGDVYEGQTINDIYHGFGIYSSSVGSYHEGFWKNGKAEGKGTSVDTLGNKYIGDFYDDKRHGYGVENYQNGERYEGNFKDDVKSGLGKYFYENGDYYEGEWAQNVCWGKGCQYYKDGSIFEGSWVKDEKHGKGFLTKANGVKIIQIFEMGEILKEFMQEGNNIKVLTS